jgi:hypothetical protein
MSPTDRRAVLKGIGAAATVALAGCTSEEPTETEDGVTDPTDTDDGMGTETDMETMDASVRVAHFSPDAPNVDVYVDGDAVLEDVPFRAVSDYLAVPAGARTVEITAAGDPDTVAFSGDVDVAGGTSYTVAAIGELTSEDTEFRPLVLEDRVEGPDGDDASVRVVHASPDAPAVDVTVASSGDAIVDGAAFGDSASVAVPAGDYTLEVRPDTMENDGDVVADFDVSLEAGAVYTAFAGGYLSPDDEPADAPFDLTVALDADGNMG